VVTTSGGSGTSTIPFTVLAVSDAPTISSFTPTIALAGTAVTISGTNFVTSPTTNNRLRFNRTLALVGTVTSTSIATTVPYGATSGRLSIATPAASAASADDFFVPPEGFGVADVASTGRVTVGGSGVTVSIPSYKAALLVFDGTAGQQVTLGYSNISVSLLGSDMTVYRPEGGILSSQPVGFFGGDTHIASLPVTGTYQLLIKPQGSYSGNITVTLSQDLAVGPLVVGGSSVTANITRPGQRARTTFSGTAGQWLSLYSNSTSYPPWMQLALTVTKPDGSTFFNGSVTASDGTVNWGPLPVTGTYTIVVDPEYANTPSFNLLLSEAISATMSVGGSSLPVTIPRAGQYARISFDGTAGQRISIGLTSFTLNTADFSILKPDGSTFYVQSGIWGTGTIGAVDVPSLPTTGTYVIQVDPSSNYTGAVTLLLSEEVSGSIVPGGSAVTVSITRGGQRARLTFSGSAGQRVSLKATGVTIDQSLVSIVRPDGSTQPVMTAYSNTVGFVDPTTLASSGTYALLIDPNATNTGDITLTLYDVPANPTGSVTVNGSAFTVSLPVPGQNGDVSFSGSSGEGITIRGANNTIGCLGLTLYEAGGNSSGIHICTTAFTMGWTLGSGSIPTHGIPAAWTSA